MPRAPAALWEVHVRVPPGGTVSLWCKRSGDRLTNGVVRMNTPADTLRLLELLLETFAHGDQLFITARAGDSKMSMWTTSSRAAGLYWCAAALAQLWRSPTELALAAAEPPLIAPVRHTA